MPEITYGRNYDGSIITEYQRSAAALLGTKPTTLSSRLKKLGIDKASYSAPKS